MKLFGYIDDLFSWFFNWQYSMGLWNFIIVPIEILIFAIVKSKFRTVIM